MKSQHLINSHVQAIIMTVARELNAEPERMMGYTRSEPQLIGGRQLVMWVARHAFQLNWAQLERATQRDHTTVLYGVRQFGILMAEDTFWRNMAHHLLEYVQTDEYLHVVDELALMGRKRVPLHRKPRVLRVTRKNKRGEFTEVAWAERHGAHGSTKGYFEVQNDRFVARMREALQDPTTQDTNKG